MSKYNLENTRKDKRLTEHVVTVPNATFTLRQFHLLETGLPAPVPKFVEIETNEGTFHMQIEDATFVARS